MELISWNINGLRAAAKKGLTDYMYQRKADIYCLQEIKAHPGQLPPKLLQLDGYKAYFHPAQRKGYSGIACYSRQEPRAVKIGTGNHKFDIEGRMLMLDYGDFLLYNGYFPNGTARSERLEYKLSFYAYFADMIGNQLAAGKNIIICGDFNTAHMERDLARPKENERASGFLPEERLWIDRLLESGLIDTYRLFDQDGGKYTWWDMRNRARERNIGWRIDYFLASKSLLPRIRAAGIEADQQGSDHCPVSLSLY